MEAARTKILEVLKEYPKGLGFVSLKTKLGHAIDYLASLSDNGSISTVRVHNDVYEKWLPKGILEIEASGDKTYRDTPTKLVFFNPIYGESERELSDLEKRSHPVIEEVSVEEAKREKKLKKLEEAATRILEKLKDYPRGMDFLTMKEVLNPDDRKYLGYLIREKRISATSVHKKTYQEWFPDKKEGLGQFSNKSPRPVLFHPTYEEVARELSDLEKRLYEPRSKTLRVLEKHGVEKKKPEEKTETEELKKDIETMQRESGINLEETYFKQVTELELNSFLNYLDGVKQQIDTLKEQIKKHYKSSLENVEALKKDFVNKIREKE